MSTSATSLQEQEELLCHVCLEGDAAAGGGGGQQLMHGGCGCRGSAGFAHMRCLVEAAEHNPDSWTDCQTCKNEYTGAVELRLAREHDERAHDGRAHDERLSTMDTKHNLGAALTGMGHFAEARAVYEEVVAQRTKKQGRMHVETLVSKGQLALLLQSTGAQEEARQLFQEVVAEQTAQLGGGAQPLPMLSPSPPNTHACTPPHAHLWQVF